MIAQMINILRLVNLPIVCFRVLLWPLGRGVAD